MSEPGGKWAESVGLKIGQFLGKRVHLGGCADDSSAHEPLPPCPFVPQLAGSKLPPGVDLRRWMPVVDDEGDLASSSACALASAFEYLIYREHRMRVDVSRLFLYFNQRLWTATVHDNHGAGLGDGVRVLQRLGVPLERMWPYHPDLFAVQPPEQVYRAAARHRIGTYHQVPTELSSLRACLAGGFPVAVALRIFPSFTKPSPDGVYPVPHADEEEQGVRALLLVGYNDREQLFVVRNSWGPSWGDQGYGYLPYDYAANHAFARSAWAVRAGGDANFPDDEHVQPDLASLPKAPPPPSIEPGQDVWSAFSRALAARSNPFEAAAVAASGRVDTAVTGLTGSTAAGHLVGGVVRGFMPMMLDQHSHDDGGVLVGPDRHKEILDQLRASPPEAPAAHHPWDDGLDEESIFLPGVHGAPRSFDDLARDAPAAADAAAPPADPWARARAARSSSEAIEERWRQLGGESGPLGLGVAPERPMPDDVGRFVVFEHGVIVWHPDKGAFEILMPLLQLWSSGGAERGPLGYPISGEGFLGNARRGRFAHFEHGILIDWGPDEQGADRPPIQLLRGDLLYERWLQVGADRSPLGWPTEPPAPLPRGGRSLACERGLLVQPPGGRGAAVLMGPMVRLWASTGGPDGEAGYPTGDTRMEEEGGEPMWVTPFERATLTFSPLSGLRLLPR